MRLEPSEGSLSREATTAYIAVGVSLMALTLTPNGVTGCSHGCKPVQTHG